MNSDSTKLADAFCVYHGLDKSIKTELVTLIENCLFKLREKAVWLIKWIYNIMELS